MSLHEAQQQIATNWISNMIKDENQEQFIHP